MKFLIVPIVMAFCSSGWAYNYKIPNMTPPKAAKFQKSQRERMTVIQAIKDKGYAGESDDGLVKIRDLTKLTEKEKKFVEQMVTDENRDRTGMYNEIAAFNKMSAKEKSLLIQNAYEVYRNSDRKGNYYFDKGTWQKRY